MSVGRRPEAPGGNIGGVCDGNAKGCGVPGSSYDAGWDDIFQAVPVVGLGIASILHGVGEVNGLANSWTVVVVSSAASIIGVVTAWTGNVAERRLFRAREEVLTLHGVVPICAKCKMIKDKDGDWHQMESYISKRTEAEFTHGLCPPCFRGEMAELDSTDAPSSTS